MSVVYVNFSIPLLICTCVCEIMLIAIKLKCLIIQIEVFKYICNEVTI